MLRIANVIFACDERRLDSLALQHNAARSFVPDVDAEVPFDVLQRTPLGLGHHEDHPQQLQDHHDAEE